MNSKNDQHLRDFKVALRKAASMGDGGDTELIHANKAEEKLLKANGGAGTVNPKTGLREYRPAGSWGKDAAPSGGRVSSGNRSDSTGGNRNGGLTDKDIVSDEGWGKGGDPNGPSITRSNKGRVESVTGTDVPNTTFNHPNYQPGDVPSVPNASLGQILGTAVSAALGLAAPGAGLLNSAPDIADSVSAGNANSVGTGGFAGRAIDAAFGGVPGKREGWSNPDPNASGRQRRTDAPLVQTAPAARGRVQNEGAQVFDPNSQITSAPGVWPPVRASRGI